MYSIFIYFVQKCPITYLTLSLKPVIYSNLWNHSSNTVAIESLPLLWLSEDAVRCCNLLLRKWFQIQIPTFTPNSYTHTNSVRQKAKMRGDATMNQTLTSLDSEYLHAIDGLSPN